MSVDLAAPGSRAQLRRGSGVVMAVVFTTSLVRSAELAELPLRALLKQQFDCSPGQMAVFLGVVGFAWYVKPLAGFLSDQHAFLGTRRRHYILLGGVGGAAALGAVALAPFDWVVLLVGMTLVNVFAVIGNTAAGGLLVDLGRRHGALAALSSLRVATMSLATLLASLAGGLLADRWFGWTCTVGALLLLLMAAAVRAAPPERGSLSEPPSGALALRLKDAVTHLRGRTIGSVSLLMLAFHVAPGFDSLFYYYQHDALRLSHWQIGLLSALNCVGSLLGAAAYVRLAGRVSPRFLVPAGIMLSGAIALLYLAYRSLALAALLEPIIGFGVTLGMLPLYDLAARASPDRHEALVFAWMMSLGNAALALSDVMGSALAAAFGLDLPAVVVVFASLTMSSAAFLVFVPTALLERDALVDA